MPTQKWDQKQWSLAEVERHLDEFEKTQGPEMAQRVNNSDLCAVWYKYGPIAKMIAGALFFAPKLKKGFLILVQALDTNCDITDPS